MTTIAFDLGTLPVATAERLIYVLLLTAVAGHRPAVFQCMGNALLDHRLFGAADLRLPVMTRGELENAILAVRSMAIALEEWAIRSGTPLPGAAELLDAVQDALRLDLELLTVSSHPKGVS
jgi:hypothetical protein